jgi:hypothetical protein
MGRERKELRVTASVSRHNSTQDDLDDVDWNELKRQIEVLCYQYKHIRAEVD